MQPFSGLLSLLLASLRQLPPEEYCVVFHILPIQPLPYILPCQALQTMALALFPGSPDRTEDRLEVDHGEGGEAGSQLVQIVRDFPEPLACLHQ